MKRFKLLATSALTVIAILFAHLPIQAWNSTGHRVISYIAYDQMEPEKRATIVEILKEHPRFEKDFINKMPDDISETDQATKDRWIFLHAATWPDIARGFRGEDREKYHNSTWHYINKPLYLDLVSEQALSDNLSVNLSIDPEDGTELKKINVIQALKYCEKKMKDPSVSKQDKAVYICWIMHCCEDLHQPYHSTALFSKETFPRGDRGGNGIKIRSTSLHSKWDKLIGTSRRLNSIAAKAVGISHDPELKQLGEEAIQRMKYTEWLDESYELAKKYGYTPEILNAIQECECEERRLQPLPRLSNAYYEKAGAIANQRAAQAGWRLAEVLKSVQ